VAGDGQCAVVAYLPVGVAILLQRNSLGLLRFCVKAFVTWLVIWSALFFMLLLHWDSRYQRFGELFGTLPLHAAAFGTFSLGFVTFIACSRWHRERLEEAMGSGK
jgi:hypothetical protein